MGQKVNPTSFRLSPKKDWRSKWISKQDFAKFVVEDIKIRQTINDLLGFRASVAVIEIERPRGEIVVTIRTAKPGVVIGRSGSGAEALKAALGKLTGEKVKLNIEEVRNPETVAQLMAENVASQLERRMAFRRVIKNAVDNAMKGGALGAKISVSGRLNGAEMARREVTMQGSIPLHTIKADIDYATAEAKTTYGVIGVKAWIYKG
ncbi:30S ribosomal protein S3 [Candidatus Saccharibacteria bacterium]|nr:30S ribosomal protein S3 [Candidatus Saccharibacteria bacterium]